MKSKILLSALSILLLLSTGCTALLVEGEIHAGRQALLLDRPGQALFRFQRAAQLKPEYLTWFTELDQGVWTYVGKSHYMLGNLTAARQALERAKATHKEDYLARLYLGLVLARLGERERGLREIRAGLRGLKRWLIDVDRYSIESAYWDPNRRLRSEIQKSLALIESREFTWAGLIAIGEWLGREFEEEIDLVEEDKIDEDRSDDGDGSAD